MKLIRRGIRPSNKKRTKKHSVGVMLLDPNNEDDLKNLIAMDLPGRFPITSASGNKYIFVMLDYDADYIQATPMKSRKKEEIIRCFQLCYRELKLAGFTAQLLKLDNEISNELIRIIEEDESLDYQLVSPGDHRRNPAERAIQTFKNHFIAILDGADKDFPKDRWDLLLPHAVITLNLFRPSRLNPRISAYTMIHGVFDFSKTPLAPAGCKIIIHVRTDERPTWANHGMRGFYIGPCLKHFRCYECYMPLENSTRKSNTVEFFPDMCDNPIIKPSERLNMILTNLVDALTTPAPSIPSVQYGTELNDAIRRLQTLLCRDAQGKQITARPEVQLAPPRVLPTRDKGPTTRLQTYQPEAIGTIIRKKFNEDGNYYEGEVTKYDPINKFYSIKYLDGDEEDFDHNEMTKYKKRRQQYNVSLHQAHLLRGKYNHNVFFIPTKASPNPVKTDYLRHRASIVLQHKIDELTEKASEFACAASGRIWDEELNKMASYRDLIQHQNVAIRTRWLTSGENELGRLFRGFKPNNIEGIGVLNWIPKSDVPANKPTPLHHAQTSQKRGTESNPYHLLR